MVDLHIARSVNASFVASRPLVAVVPGGTSGIAAYTIQQLVKHHGKNGQHLRAYLVGRNIAAAEKVIAMCNTICNTAEVVFVRSPDLSLLKNVDKACEEISRLEKGREYGGPARVDLLVMSHADLHFGARRETTEGLDKTMSLLYYSRMRFITSLLPLLLAAPTHARIISIYGGGLEKNLPRFYHDDLSLRSPDHYSLLAYRTHVPVMTTFFFENLARQNPGKLSLTHIFPSLVVTPAFDASYHPWWFKALWSIMRPLSGWLSVSADEIGERVLFCASERFPAKGSIEETEAGPPIARGTDGLLGSGAYSVDHKGETSDIEKTYATMRRENFGQVVLEHTDDVFEAVNRGQVFTG